MRALPTVLLVLVLLAPLAPADAGQERDYSGRASTCDPVKALRLQPGPPCPTTRHEGTLHQTGCEGRLCLLRVDGMAAGEGFPALRKTLLAQVVVQGVVRAELCRAQATGEGLLCAGTVSVALDFSPAVECIDVRVRTTMTELADHPPTLPVRAETGFMACYEGGQVNLT